MRASSESRPYADEPQERLDEAVRTLVARKEAWAEMPLARRIGYLEAALQGSVETAEAQVRAACQAKGLDPKSPRAAEEWLGGPLIQIRVIRTLLDTLRHLDRHGSLPLESREVRVRDDGQVVVRVFPGNLTDRVTYAGFKAEIWMQPEVTPETLPQHMGFMHRDPVTAGKVALVLAAGNVASIGPLDVVHKLFVEGQVVILKINPVNGYLAPFWERAFGRLIHDGFLRVVHGGPEVGEYLVHHPEVEEIHITGSDRTHDAIVWGTGEEGAARRARQEPRLHKRITSELGNVSPVIVVPGRWSRSDLRFAAENVATQLTNNAGFNCNASRVLVTQAEWPQRQAFLDALGKVLETLPTRPAYYPGAHERYRSFLEAHPQALQVGEAQGDHLPWVVLRDVSPEDHHNPAFRREAFCGLMAETAIPAETPEAFLDSAVAFANEHLWGTLSATLIVDPASRKSLGASFDQAVADLRYGSVGINHWPALAYGLGTTTWGAFPGHGWEDIQSGIGTVHNTRLFEKPQKSVIEGPFRVRPKPVWFVTHPDPLPLAVRATHLEADPRLARLPGLLWHALKA